MKLEEARAEGLIAQRPCRYGVMEFLRTDYYIARSLGQYGEFSEGEVELWRWLLKAGDTVVTAGANCGAHVVALARIVGESGRVLAVEPQSLLCELAQANVSANHLPQATVRRAALGARPGTAYFPMLDYRWPNNFGGIGVLAGVDEYADAIEMTTVDRLVGDADVRMIHLDVEGGEQAALEGAAQTIKRCRPVLYVEVDRPEQRDALMVWFRQHQYQPMYHTPPLFNPDNFAHSPVDSFPGTNSINVLAVPV